MPIGVHAHGSYSVSTTLTAFVVWPGALGVPVPVSTFSGRPNPSSVVRVHRFTGVEFTVSNTVFCEYSYPTVSPVGKVFDEGRPINVKVLYEVPLDSPFAPDVDVNPKASFQPIVEDNPDTVTDCGTA